VKKETSPSVYANGDALCLTKHQKHENYPVSQNKHEQDELASLNLQELEDCCDDSRSIPRYSDERPHHLDLAWYYNPDGARAYTTKQTNHHHHDQ